MKIARAGVASSDSIRKRIAHKPVSCTASVIGRAPSRPVASAKPIHSAGSSSSTSTDVFSRENRPDRSCHGHGVFCIGCVERGRRGLTRSRPPAGAGLAHGAAPATWRKPSGALNAAGSCGP